MKIYRTISAARCAIADRMLITRGAKGKLPQEYINYYKILESISGPSTHRPKEIVRNWYTAYKHNVERIDNAERILYAGERKSLTSRIFHRLFHK